MTEEHQFDEKVQQLVNEELRHNPRKCATEAWKRLHAANSLKDTHWNPLAKQESDEEESDEAKQ